MKTSNINKPIGDRLKHLALGLTAAAVLVAGTAPVLGQGNTGSGGTITYTDSSGLNPRSSLPYVGGYVVHKFTNSGTLSIPAAAVGDVLVVAGGGGGGGSTGGGGGAGGYIYSNSFSVASGNTTVTVGAGGNGGTGNIMGANGTNSVFGTLTAVGGGGGANNNQGAKAGAGGGSGGGGSELGGGGAATPPGQGNAGGASLNWNAPWRTGGGGGAGSIGSNGTASAFGNGGIGLSNTISGVTNWYAGGGGGGTYLDSLGGVGGSGVGGGGAGTSFPASANGLPNTGGGGGGMGNNKTVKAGSGGSGIVIVRYPYVELLSIVVASPTDNQLFFLGSSITATATVGGGTSPYSVTYHYKLTTDSSYTDLGPVGPFGSTNTFEQTLGTLPTGVYQIYATVTDNLSSTATSGTSTFIVYFSQGNSGAGGTITYTDLNGANPRSTPPYPNGYVIHTFTTSGTLSLPASVTAADVLVVGGGGGGGGGTGGGGGAGGTGALTGPGAINGTPGSLSAFGSIQAAGGGFGACNNGSNVGGNGGSGGGGSGNASIAGGNGTSGQGNAGGASNPWNDPYLGGGGGGAGAAGSAPTGGAGLSTNISGSTAWHAGGGGGGSYNTAGGDGGQGGGGNAGANGTSNTGGGGGGGTSATGGTAGGGGSGIVRYPFVGPLAIEVASPTDNQPFWSGSSITAMATAGGGTSPYSVTYHYKLMTDSSYTDVGPVGPFGSTNTFEQTLGTLPMGVYQIYATVTDNASGTAISATNTFIVTLPQGNSGAGGTITYTDSSGANPRSLQPYADGYVVHTFTTSGTLSLLTSATADVLVVGGGGGGGGGTGGGGGAGGYLYNAGVAVDFDDTPVTVGGGGMGGSPSSPYRGGDGGNSVFGSLTALGGGGGGANQPPFPSTGYTDPSSGGSGGGGSGTTNRAGAAGTAGQGNAGGAAGAWSGNYPCGGGGGAGGSGSDGATSAGGAGGPGLTNSISGSAVAHAGGGGGGVYQTTSGGSGGVGGGGNGGMAGGGATSGQANTGGGGGGQGGNATADAGSGGSGIVIVRYPYASSVPQEAPQIIDQPVNQTVTEGQDVQFSVRAIGTRPLTYQWWYATPAGEPQFAWPDATNRTLLFISTTPDYSGYPFVVVVANGFGSVTSSVATLTVLVPARIEIEPVDQFVLRGGTATFGVGAAGTDPLLYQWFFGLTPLLDQTNADLVITNVQAANTGGYHVVVSNFVGSATSLVATLTLSNRPPVAQNTNLGTVANRAAEVAIAKLLAQCADPDGDPISLLSVSNSTNGALVSIVGSNIVYTPVTDFVGADRFSYTISDGRGGLATGYVLVEVYPGNTASLNIVSVEAVAGGLRFTFAGIPGYNYGVERAIEVKGPWTNIATVVASPIGLTSFTDTNAPSGGAFYRTTYP